MRRLVRAFAGRTYHIVGNLKSWLIYTCRTGISDRDFHLRTNEQMWSETSEIVRMEYGDTYFRAFLDMMMMGLRMSSKKTYKVIDDLVHATTAKFPYTRYVPQIQTALMMDSFMVQTNWIQDRVLNWLLKVKCTPFSMRKRTGGSRKVSSADGHLS